MSDRKYNYYITRTVEHIHRVQNNMVKIVTDFKEKLMLSTLDCQQLMYNVMNHDRSKFSVKQFSPYIELTEYYYQRKNLGNKNYKYPEGVEAKVELAVEDHYQQENHHPERLRDDNGAIAILMTDHECIEIICDLQAMSQEFGEGSCRKFFEEVWKPKHSGYFQYDDFYFWCSIRRMDDVITCFEGELCDMSRHR